MKGERITSLHQEVFPYSQQADPGEGLCTVERMPPKSANPFLKKPAKLPSSYYISALVLLVHRPLDQVIRPSAYLPKRMLWSDPAPETKLPNALWQGPLAYEIHSLQQPSLAASRRGHKSYLLIKEAFKWITPQQAGGCVFGVVNKWLQSY